MGIQDLLKTGRGQLPEERPRPQHPGGVNEAVEITQLNGFGHQPRRPPTPGRRCRPRRGPGPRGAAGRGRLFQGGTCRALITRFTPCSLASSSARAFPMPREAPVMIKVLPDRLFIKKIKAVWKNFANGLKKSRLGCARASNLMKGFLVAKFGAELRSLGHHLRRPEQKGVVAVGRQQGEADGDAAHLSQRQGHLGQPAQPGDGGEGQGAGIVAGPG